MIDIISSGGEKMKRILVSALLMLCLLASLILPAFAEPAALALSAEGLAFLQEFDVPGT